MYLVLALIAGGRWASVGCAPRGDSSVASSAAQPSCSGSRVALPASPRARRCPTEIPCPAPAAATGGAGSSAEPALRGERIFSLGAASPPCAGGSRVPSRGWSSPVAVSGGLDCRGAQIHPHSKPGATSGGVFPPPVPPPCSPRCSMQVQELWGSSGHCQGHLSPCSHPARGAHGAPRPWQGWAGCREGKGWGRTHLQHRGSGGCWGGREPAGS